jgi:hypothetical protein
MEAKVQAVIVDDEETVWKLCLFLIQSTVLIYK